LERVVSPGVDCDAIGGCSSIIELHDCVIARGEDDGVIR
jgi:hypothetical protein